LPGKLRKLIQINHPTEPWPFAAPMTGTTALIWLSLPVDSHLGHRDRGLSSCGSGNSTGDQSWYEITKSSAIRSIPAADVPGFQFTWNQNGYWLRYRKMA
jgi:hypothetical protein